MRAQTIWGMRFRGVVASTFTVVLLTVGLILATGTPTEASTSVEVVVGHNAPELEQFAANQLCRYLGELFGIKTHPTATVTNSPSTVFLIGSPSTNPLVKQANSRTSFPKVSDQGIVLRSIRFEGHPAMLVGGGSPKATLWAVYDLASRWGVHYLLHGDVLPKRSTFHLPSLNVVEEPMLRDRQFRTIDEFPMGPISWGMADFRPFIDQLAKLKFNRLFPVIWPFGPFLKYQVDGINTSSATIFFGDRFPITSDMPGRFLFGNGKEYWNPDLPYGGSYAQFEAAGERLMHRMIAYGHKRGMKSIICITPTQFPLEFAPLLKSGVKVRIVHVQVISPGPHTSLDDPNLIKLATAVIRATVNTYPEADGLDLQMPEFRQWTGEYQRVWNVLNAKYDLDKVKSLDAILNEARHRKNYPGGPKRAVNEVKGDLAALYFYDHLFNGLKILKNTRNPNIRLSFDGVAEELFPILNRIIPPGSETLNFVDYTPSRVVRRQEVLSEIPAHKLPALLLYTLNDDNIGPLPQMMAGSLHILTQDLIRYGWAGFSTRYWVISDQDPTVAYLSKASWDAGTTPDSVFRDQVRAACGAGCVSDMMDAFHSLEKVTVGLEWHGLGFAFPVKGMMMKNWKPTPFPPALEQCRMGYRRALDDVRRAQANVKTPKAQKYLSYWAGRFQFATGYMDTADEVHQAAMAEAAKRPDQELADAEKALATIRSAIDAYARVARDRSDRGAIAMLDEFAYRPLAAKVAELKK